MTVSSCCFCDVSIKTGSPVKSCLAVLVLSPKNNAFPVLPNPLFLAPLGNTAGRSKVSTISLVYKNKRLEIFF